MKARLLCVLVVIVLLSTACGDDNTSSEATGQDATATSGGELDEGLCPGNTAEEVIASDGYDGTGTTITLVAHDSFAVSDGTLEVFTEQTGIEVDVITTGDTGDLVASSILTAGDDPLGDVIFGVDNTFACRAVNEGVFVPYRPAGLDSLVDEALIDDAGFLTPIDFSDVCVNYWTDALERPPADLDDLTDPAFEGQFVTQNAESSSPGFAFLLATIDRYGDDWESYWSDLADNDVAISSDWNDAYYNQFVGGGGDRAIVTSYASSPPVEVIYSDPPVDEPPTAVMLDSCFRQVEFAGIAAGTDEPQAAALLVDFLLSEAYQNDIALNQFVYPVLADIELPAIFTEFGPLADDPAELAPAEIEAHRDEWTARWAKLVTG
jgi:thiamine transport system substrate-binding protein